MADRLRDILEPDRARRYPEDLRVILRALDALALYRVHRRLERGSRLDIAPYLGAPREVFSPPRRYPPPQRT